MTSGVSRESFKEMPINNKVDVIFDLAVETSENIKCIKTKVHDIEEKYNNLPCEKQSTNIKWLRRLVVIFLVVFLGGAVGYFFGG